MGVTIRSGRRALWAGLGTAALVSLTLAVPGLSAQQLPIKTAPLPGADLICEGNPGSARAAGVALAAPDSAEAVRLTNTATQAMILGDLEGALVLLDRALSLDATAAEAVYLRARILQEQGETEAAVGALCAYLALRPDGASAREVRRQLDEARDGGLAEGIAETYRRALALEFEGRLDEAEAAFTQVLSARPNAAHALYNRGVVRSALGWTDSARSDFQRYVQLEPTPSDAGAVARFLASIGAPLDPAGLAARDARAGPVGLRSGTAFAVGALLPGGGQYYTGRPALGVAVTALAGGMLATGLLYERTTVRCLDATIETDCPEELVASRDTSRPYLVPALLAAGGVMLGAAIEAALHTSRRASGSDAAAGDGSPRLGLGGDVYYDGTAVHLGLIRLRF